jgi:hypothetical protein
VKLRARIVVFSGEGPAAVDLLERFLSRGLSAQRAVDELAAAPPKRVPRKQGRKVAKPRVR